MSDGNGPSLREFVEELLKGTAQRIDALSDRLDLRWTEHQRAHDTAEQVHHQTHETEERARANAVEVINERLHGINGWREEEKETKATLVRQDVFDARHAALRAETDKRASAQEERLRAMENKQANLDGRIAAIGIAIAIIPTIIAIMAFVQSQ